MKFRYDGPHDEVEIDGFGAVKNGHRIEASGDVAQSLSKQSDWTRVDKPKPRETASATDAPQPAAGKNEE